MFKSEFSCTCGGGDRSKCLKVCSIADGSSVNDGDCACGSTNCNAATGYYCLASLNKCAKIKISPACIYTNGFVVNSKICTCGIRECDATRGLFCSASSSRCSKWKSTDPGDSCTGCEDLLGAKSGIAWDDGYGDGCAAFKDLCPDYGTDDEGEGAANDKW